MKIHNLLRGLSASDFILIVNLRMLFNSELDGSTTDSCFYTLEGAIALHNQLAELKKFKERSEKTSWFAQRKNS